jgi:hypothetical protein
VGESEKEREGGPTMMSFVLSFFFFFRMIRIERCNRVSLGIGFVLLFFYLFVERECVCVFLFSLLKYDFRFFSLSHGDERGRMRMR